MLATAQKTGQDMATRKTRLSEIPLMIGWLEAEKERNHWDDDVLDYENLSIDTITCGQRVMAIYPSHPVLCLESAAVNPETTPLERWEAAKIGIANACNRAVALGIREIVFQSSDESMDKHMAKLGFTRETYMRKKL